MMAAQGCDAGTIVYQVSAKTLAAGCLADVQLLKSVAMLPLCGVGFQNALGARLRPKLRFT